jgi:uncharacterized GH25 family protein
MRHVRGVLFAALVLVGSGAGGRAHDLKVLASHFSTKPGEKATIFLSWGHALPVDDLVDGDSLERYELVSPAGTAQLLTRDKRSLQANRVELAEAGVYQAVAIRKASVITFVRDADGRKQMKRGPKTAVKGGTIEQALRSQQLAKAVIVVGSSREAAETPKALGLPLEIVPLSSPARWTAGSSLRFKVLRDGNPVRQEQVLATYSGFKPDDAWCYATTTDDAGIATVRVGQPGTWVLRVQQRTPAAESVRAEYDYDALSATLAFEVRP